MTAATINRIQYAPTNQVCHKCGGTAYATEHRRVEGGWLVFNTCEGHTGLFLLDELWQREGRNVN